MNRSKNLKQRKKSSIKVDFGKVAEYELAAKLLAEGVMPCWPSSAETPYDMIVDTGTKRLKVQVKGTGQLGRSNLRLKKESGPYEKGDFDVLAVWLRPIDVWYIMPIKAILGVASLTIRDSSIEQSKWLRYRNNWSILGL